MIADVTGIYCGACGAVIEEPLDVENDKRSPCSACGSTRRHFKTTLGAPSMVDPESGDVARDKSLGQQQGHGQANHLSRGSTEDKIVGVVGRCIYCRKDDRSLTDEHIVAFGFNGRWVLGKASCRDCAKVTGRIEREVLRGPFWPWRTVLGYRTRRPRERPQRLPIVVHRNGGAERVHVPVDQYPVRLFLPHFKLPACLDSRAYRTGIDVDGIVMLANREAEQRFCDAFGAQEISVEATYTTAFARMLAKMALGFAVWVFGLDALQDDYVTPVILGSSDEVGRWVGCAPKNGPPSRSGVAYTVTANNDILIQMNVSAEAPEPQYWVVVGRLKPGAVASFSPDAL